MKYVGLKVQESTTHLTDLNTKKERERDYNFETYGICYFGQTVKKVC